MPEPDDTIDTCGLRCPLPVLKARKRLKALSPGGVLLLLADDPAAIIDVPFFCDEQGYELVDHASDNGVLRFHIRKV